MRGLLITILILASFLSFPSNIEAQQIQAESLLHMHTIYSSGNETIEELVARARQTGDKILFITDHDVIRMEYGIFPFRNILKKTVERKSVNSIGPARYLEELKRINSKYEDMVIIPGVESTAHYFWTGNPLTGSLVSNNWSKHIDIIGLETPEQFKSLPIIHNGFSTRYTKVFLPRFAAFLSAFILSAVLYFTGGKALKKISLILMIISILLAVNYHPFKSSMFTQYDTDAGVLPYQILIDYASETGALSIWSHPESNFEERQINSVLMQTPKHASDLINTEGYTGFEALYRDRLEMIESGKEWDTILLQYCEGTRKNPAWAVGGIDYHGDEDERIDEVETVLILDNINQKEAIDAISNGRCYARRNSTNNKIILEEFSIKGIGNTSPAGMGQVAMTIGVPEINIKINEKNGNSFQFDLQLIRNGNIVKEIKESAPYEETLNDYIDENAKGRGYYRLLIKTDEGDRIVSNPIFYDYR